MATLSNLYENTVAVRIGGKEHRDWLSYDIDSDFLIPADGFDFARFIREKLRSHHQ